jgi:hypothetical protein
MKRNRLAILLAGTIGSVAMMSTLAIGSASAANICNVEVTRLENYELQDNDPQDEIKFKLGDDEYGVFTFNEDQYRTNSLGHPDESTAGSSVRFELWEKDSVVRTTIATHYLSCIDGDHNDTVFEGNGGGYLLSYHTSH